MRPSTIKTIFKKELLDTLRDRRTLIFMLAVPLLAMPLLISLMMQLVSGQMSKSMLEVSSVVVGMLAGGCLASSSSFVHRMWPTLGTTTTTEPSRAYLASRTSPPLTVSAS